MWHLTWKMKMKEKEIYKLADEFLERASTLYHLVPEEEVRSRETMQYAFNMLHECIRNMARIASHHQAKAKKKK
jgi:hypothetical protein